MSAPLPFQIVESGSNVNGSYIKFSDGTLICRKNGIDVEANILVKEVALPATFIDTDYTIIAVNAFANSGNIIWNSGSLTNNAIRLYPRKSDGNAIDMVERCNYIAMRLLETKERK